jgi:beta-lactamase class D
MAAPPCTLIVDAMNGDTLHIEGPCGTRISPASTFKVALSLIGFDSGILVDAHTPARPYKAEYKAMMDSWKVTTDPTSWLEDSVVWYSQVMTQELGAERFQNYVDRLNYGNRDLSGGLTTAWLSSSLKISAVEEVIFIRHMLAGDLPVSPKAVAITKAIMPKFPAAEDWTVYGKTGTGLQPGADGKPDRNRQFGWFVGWATRGQKTVAFAHLVLDDAKAEDRAGIRARMELVDRLPHLVAAKANMR